MIKRYFKAEEDATEEDQWFDTGDVAALHPDGTMQITDRSKDVIKSGGEWISSIELENAAVGCPGVAEAAAIGIPHPKWDERPLLVCVRAPGSDVCAVKIRDHLTAHVAKWWLPDAIEFVDELPHTATGKLQQADPARPIPRLSLRRCANRWWGATRSCALRRQERRPALQLTLAALLPSQEHGDARRAAQSLSAPKSRTFRRISRPHGRSI